jgi:hypothetical protein
VSASELLAMWDVPEPLDMLLSLEAKRRDLFRTCTFPLKILERVYEKMRKYLATRCDCNSGGVTY